MRIAVVHISDLHIRTRTDAILSRANAIANAIPSVTQERIHVILAWTGDIAFSGRPEEYSLATSLVDNLESSLKLHPKINFLGSVFVPGNHDCNFDLSGDARSPLIEGLPARINQIDPTGDMVHQITRPQENFFTFLQARGINVSNRLVWEQTFDTDQVQVLVRCCNTSWLSQLPEKPTLLFPEHAINESKAPLTISLLHHPYSWFEPTNAKAFRRKLEIDSDIILSGHEHDPETFARLGTESSTNYIHANALAAPNAHTGFSVSLVDTVNASLEIFSFTWSDPLYIRSGEYELPFVRKQRAIVNKFLRSTDFDKLLDEVTTPFSHPRKELRLADIYVQPPLTHLISDINGKSSDQTIAAEAVMDFILSEKVVRISAPTGYGKSALARILCRDLLDLRSMVPIYLSPSLISGYDLDKISTSVERTFSKQYGASILENYRQLALSAKVIVFDDWNHLRFNENGKRELLKSLKACADYVVILDDVASFIQRLNDLTLEDGPRPTLCELRQFGYQLRGLLIDKWHRLGRAFEVSEGTLAHDVSVSEHLINALIGRGVMPSTPLFLLSALQMQREAANSGGDYGSYGHIYQSLITSRLSKPSSKQTPLKLIFLSYLAFRMFENQQSSLNLKQVRELANIYEKEYSFDLNYDSLLKEIADSGLIEYDGETFKFQYRYVYYYSVAHAIRTNVANEHTRDGARQHLTRLASEAHFDDNANILIFYIYLSKDRALMEEVLDNARRIFLDVPPIDLESDLAFANNLLESPISISEPSQNISENLASHRSARDEAGAQLSRTPADPNNLQEAFQIDFAMRSLEFMGQVLKNFPSDLRRDLKFALTKESYSLGLRTMGRFMAALKNGRDTIRDIVAQRLAKETAFASKTLAKQKETIDGIMIFFAQVGIYGITKKVSDALGSEDLRHTYDEVRSELGESQIATRLIDLSIRLDHFGALPEPDIFDLEKRLRGNSSAWAILSMLVAQHIALFPTNWRTRQKLVDVFKFSRTTGLPSPKQLLPGS